MYKNGKPNYNEIVFNDKQINDIIASYKGGISSVKIGKQYGVSHKVILKVLHKNNVTVDQKTFVRKYALNENYFDNIDSPNKAYILGLLYADGHNEIKKSTVCISLQEEDKDLLEKIRIEIGSDRPLEYIDYSNKHDFGYHYKNQYRMSIFSKHICLSLERLGMIPNKSLSLTFPDINSDLYPHFIRGFFDGDGTINKKCGSFGILSTKEFVTSVKNILDKNLDLQYGIISESSCKNGVTYDLRYNRKYEASKIFNWIYHNSEIYLKRKFNTYCKMYLETIA